MMQPNRTFLALSFLAICVTSLATLQERAPAVRGELPGGPIFAPDRPKPPVGNVLDIESLLGVPSDDFRMERRNNFYKKDGSDGLYRWSASGHWSNYDEAKVGDWKKSVPDPLKLNNGQIVRDAATWRNVRRPEVVRLLEDAIYGKIPVNVPKVVWTAGELTQSTNNGIATLSRTATGQFVNADGSPYAAAAGTAPARGGRGGGAGLTVTYTIPANATGPVPLVQGGNVQRTLAMGFGTVNFGGSAPNVTSQPPATNDWGAIRKYGWVVSRALDYLETDKLVDAHQVALTGHSIGGKQALVAGAFDERIGLVFASCSGEGGASMMKRDWGETLDDLAQLSPQNYADNFQKWVRHWDEMPVDAHMLVALMAPRPLLITGGTQDQWSDPVGVFWAGYFAGPVYKVLGKKDLGATEPPKPNVFLEGDLVFYNHIGGHVTTPEETAKYYELLAKNFRITPTK
jgi:hypothetical protein